MPCAGRIEDFLVSRAGARLDSVYMDSLAAANKVKVQTGRACCHA